MRIKFKRSAKLCDRIGVAAAHIKSEAEVGVRLRRTRLEFNHLLVDFLCAVIMVIAQRRLPCRRKLSEISGLRNGYIRPKGNADKENQCAPQIRFQHCSSIVAAANGTHGDSIVSTS